MNRFINIPFILITIFFLSFAPTKSEAKDCSQHQILSHKWNKCKLGLTKLKKLNPLKKLKRKDDKDKLNIEHNTEKKVLIKSKKVDELNEKCKTLVDCIFPKKKKE